MSPQYLICIGTSITDVNNFQWIFILLQEDLISSVGELVISFAGNIYLPFPSGYAGNML